MKTLRSCLTNVTSQKRRAEPDHSLGKAKFLPPQSWQINDGPNSSSLESDPSAHLDTDRNICKETGLREGTIKNRVTECKVTSSDYILSTGDTVSWFLTSFPWITHFRSQPAFKGNFSKIKRWRHTGSSPGLLLLKITLVSLLFPSNPWEEQKRSLPRAKQLSAFVLWLVPFRRKK